jgi:hypothetical protein
MELKTQTPFRPKGFILQLPATDSESNGGFLSPILYIGSCAVTASLYFRSEVPPLPLNIITIWAEELETITEGIISPGFKSPGKQTYGKKRGEQPHA